MQWLATAQKRRLLPKNVTPDIAWLLAQGKKYGFSANLLHKIDYIYRSSVGELATQSVLFRFTYFIETLKTMSEALAIEGDFSLPANRVVRTL